RSVSVKDMRDAIVPALIRLVEQGKIGFYGMTALGETAALHEVLDAGLVQTAQVCFNLLNPSAAHALPPQFPAQDFGRLLDHAARLLEPRAPRVRGRFGGQGAAVRGRARRPAHPVGALRAGVISSEPMRLTFNKLHPLFVGEASPIELRSVHDPETLAAIRAGMDEYAILVLHDQPFADDEQLAFPQRLAGALHTKLGSATIH